MLNNSALPPNHNSFKLCVNAEGLANILLPFSEAAITSDHHRSLFQDYERLTRQLQLHLAKEQRICGTRSERIAIR